MRGTPDQAPAWGPDEMDRIGRAEELQLASHRQDSTLRPYVTMFSTIILIQLC